MKVVNEKADDWDKHIDPILFGHRVNSQASTKTSPLESMYGVRARLPIDLDRSDCYDDDAGVSDMRQERGVAGE